MHNSKYQCHTTACCNTDQPTSETERDWLVEHDCLHQTPSLQLTGWRWQELLKLTSGAYKYNCYRGLLNSCWIRNKNQGVGYAERNGTNATPRGTSSVLNVTSSRLLAGDGETVAVEAEGVLKRLESSSTSRVHPSTTQVLLPASPHSPSRE